MSPVGAHAQTPSASGVFTTRPQPLPLELPDATPAFQFAIYGDRTSGVPAGLKVLQQAVVDTNVIGPDLVMTVGDLVQGYNRTPQWLEEKDEYKAIMNQLKCRWFPVAGNHDVYWEQSDQDKPQGQHESNYEKHFGPLWYSFQHKNSGFLILYSDEGDPETNRKGFREGKLQTVSPEQMDFLKAALDDLKSCDHVFVFLHHPRWIGGGYEGGNWDQVHQTLAAAGNVSAVFAGHIHHMRYDGKKDGIEYYALATTGGSLSADFPDAGFLHHYNLVTVRPEGIHVATVPVGTVVDPKTFGQEYLTEVQAVAAMRPVRAGQRLPFAMDGSAWGSYSVSMQNPSAKYPLEVEIVPELPARWQVFPGHQHVSVGPGETAEVKFRLMRDISNKLVESDPLGPDFQLPVFQVRPELIWDQARIQLPEVEHSLEMALADPSQMESTQQRGLALQDIASSDQQGISIAHQQFDLPQGPFTLEAWVKPSSNQGSRGIVAKTQSSEYALFSHDGKPSFDVHIGTRYATARGKSPLAIDQWTHVAGVYDGQEVRLYVNGQLADRLPASGDRTLNALPLVLGADPDARGAATRSFAGILDEVRLSRGALYQETFSPERILSKSDQTVLLFHFDGQFGPFQWESVQQQLYRPLGPARLVEAN